MWKRSEFMLEYMKYYTDVHGFSHTIILAQDSETMASLKWLQALYSIELILWSQLYAPRVDDILLHSPGAAAV